MFRIEPLSRAVGACALAALAVCAAAAEPLVEFRESRGCRMRGSAQSVERMKEIATQGSVTWDGACRGGWIDGAGVLRHEGRVLDNGRMRRYAFFFTGVAESGVRRGQWRRESMNMFEDSSRYWTALAVISYADGVSRGSPRNVTVRSDAEFGAPFRAMLAALDRDIAQRGATATAEPARADAAPATPAPQAPVAAAPVLPAETPPPAASVRPATPQPLAAPVTTQPTATAPSPALPQPAPPVTSRAAAAVAPQSPAGSPPVTPPAAVAAAAPTPPVSARGSQAAPTDAASGESRPERPSLAAARPYSGSGLRPPQGMAAQPRDRVALEQTRGCSVDTVNGSPTGQGSVSAPRDRSLRVTGWAGDPRSNTLPARAWIQVSSVATAEAVRIPMMRSVERPDAAQAMGHPAFARSGFDQALEVSAFPAGQYLVAIIQQVDNEFLICSSVAEVSLR